MRFNSVGAGRAAFAALGQLEPVGGIVAAPRAQALVLLPYGATEQFGATRLRFAWRISVTANLAGSMSLSQRAFTLWMDAQTGQLLKYAAEAAEDDGGAEAGANDPVDAGVEDAPVDMVDPDGPDGFAAAEQLAPDLVPGSVEDRDLHGVRLPGGRRYCWPATASS